MKSKMKTTFAIIAVALMVLVAVVPMIGVFTSDSEAAAQQIKDPSSDTNLITVNVTVYKGDATTTVADGNVVVTYNKYKWTEPVVNGIATFNIYEASVPSMTISYVDEVGKAIANYTDVTLTNLDAGNTYSTVMVAGKVTKTVAIGFNNATYDDGHYTNVFTTDIVTSITKLSYKAYSDEECTKEIGTGDATITVDANGIIYATFAYAKSATVYIKLSAINLNPNTTVTVNTEKQELTNATYFVKAITQSLVTIVPSILFNKPVTVTTLVEKVEQGTPATFTKITNKEKLMPNLDPKKVVYAYFVGIPTVATPAPTYEVTLTVDGKISAAMPVNIATGVITLSKYVAGVVSLGASTQEGTVSFNVATGAETTEAVTATVDSDGRFFKFIEAQPADNAAITEAKLDVPEGTTNRTFTISDSTYSLLGIELSLTGAEGTNNYINITGTLKVATSANGENISATLSIAGSKTFGSVDAVDGVFSFYAIEGKTISFSVANAKLSGDTSIVVKAGATSNLLMNTKDVVIKLADVNGNKITGASADNIKIVDSLGIATPYKITAESNVYTVTIRADLSGAKVYFTGLAYKYSASTALKAVTLENNKTYAATEGKFIVQMFDPLDKPVYEAVVNDQSPLFTLYKAKAFSTTAGTLIIDYDDTTGKITPVADAKFPSTGGFNAYSFTATSAIMSAKDIKETPVDIVIAIPTDEAETAGKCIFAPYYILTAVDGYTYIDGYFDSVSGKLTRIDGSTAIAGASVNLYYNATSTAAVTTTTDLDGSFEIFSKVKINPTTAAEKEKWTVGFTVAGYNAGAEEKVPLYNASGVEKTNFTYGADTYTFKYFDADGEKIVTTNATITINGVAPASTYAWKAGDEVKVTMTYKTAVGPAVIGATYRTFSTHVITADEAATGIVKFVSDQSTYTIATVDKSGKEIAEATLNLYYYVNDVPMVKKVAGGAAVTTPTGNDGTGTFLLPYIDVTVPAANVTATTDVVGTEYAVLAEKDLAGFSDELVDIEYALTVIASEYEKLTFVVLDAAGENIVLADIPGEEPVDGAMGIATVYKNGKEITDDLHATPLTVLGVTYQTYTFVNDADAEYTFTINDTVGANVYTFEEELSPVLGVLRANEQWVVGDIYDSAGIHIPAAAGKKVDVYTTAAAQPVKSQAYVYDEVTNVGYWKVLIDTDLIVGFIPEEIPGYTFGLSVESDIYANERSISPVFGAVNGIPGIPQAYTFYAYLADGTIRSADAVAGVATLIIDPTDVETYAVKLTAAGADGYFVDKETYYSESALIVSPYSKITGSLPVKAAAGDYVAVELWDEGIVVDGKQANLVGNETSYTVFIDISGDEDAVAGVAFDSITATYVHNGMVYAISEVNPTSAYNPIVSDPGYALVLIGSDLILEHTDFAVVGNIAYLTADTMFEIVVQTTQVEGKQMVEKYTFAGWYINGKAVNASEPSISVELTEFANTASAKYTVETYEVVEPTPEPTPTPAVDNSIDPTVLVIGICAVIVALIAVAYAVISSRPKEKKE